MENVQNKKDLTSYGKAVAFLAIEIIAILAFNLGNSLIFYTILSVVLTGILFFVLRRQINKDGLASLGFFLFPILIYGILNAISYFNQDPAYNLYGYGFGLCIIPISLTCIAAVGYLCSINPNFKIKQVLLVIYSAVALITVINLMATLIDFAPFHTLLYKGKYIYYEGRPSSVPVSEMAYGLIGFKMTQLSVSYVSLFPSVLLSSFIPLFYSKYREDRKAFILYLSFGILGVISLVLMPTIMTILSDIVVVIVLALVVLTEKFHLAKPMKYVSIVIAALVGIALIVAILNNLNGDNFVKSLISGNRLLNKLFNGNRLAAAYNNVLDGLVDDYKAFGTPTFEQIEYPNGTPFTGSLLFDNFITGGIFGNVFFIFTMVVGIRRMFMYFKTSDDRKQDKMLMFGFVLSFLAYSLVTYSSKPFIFEDTLVPVYENGLFFVVLMIFGYCFGKSELSKPVKEEVKDEVKESEVTENEEVSI